MLQLNIDEGEIIHWLPHGLAFKVVDNEKFSEEVLPKYFKRKKLTIDHSFSPSLLSFSLSPLSYILPRLPDLLS